MLIYDIVQQRHFLKCTLSQKKSQNSLTYLKQQGTLGGCQFSASQSDFCPNINQLIKKIKSYLEFKFECNYHLIFIVKIKICIRQY